MKNMKNDHALDVIIDKAKKIYARTNTIEIQNRYEIGALVAQVYATTEWGSRGVRKMADKMGTSPTTLHRMARVTKTWSLSAVEKIRSTAKVPITWTHLEVIAYERDPKVRVRMLHFAMTRKVTTTVLKRIVYPNTSLAEHPEGFLRALRAMKTENVIAAVKVYFQTEANADRKARLAAGLAEVLMDLSLVPEAAPTPEPTP